MTDGFSQRTPQQALAALLERFTPQRLLLVGSRFPALDAFAEAHPGTCIEVAAPGRLWLAGYRLLRPGPVGQREVSPRRAGAEPVHL